MVRYLQQSKTSASRDSTTRTLSTGGWLWAPLGHIESLARDGSADGAEGIRALGVCFALLVAPALVTPALAAPSRPAASPITQQIILDETSIDGPALWSLANGTVQGGFTTSGTPTYVSAIAWAGTDPAHHLNISASTDGLHYTNKVILGELSNDRPALLAMTPAGPFVLAWTGTNPRHTLNLMYDVYGTKRKLILGETATGAPSLAALGGKIYLAWTGTDTNQSLNVLPVSVSSSGQFTLGATTILGSYSSDLGPAIAGDPHNNGQLLLTWTYRGNGASTPSAINEAYSTDGTHWTTPLVAPPPQTSVATPAILATSSQASSSGVAPYYWAWSGTDTLHSLNLIGADSPLSWPGAPSPRSTSSPPTARRWATSAAERPRYSPGPGRTRAITSTSRHSPSARLVARRVTPAKARS